MSHPEDMSSGTARRVVMQQAWIPRYRVPFFEQVRERLGERRIAFDLVHGWPYGDDASKGSAVRLDWARLADQRVVRVGSAHVAWQPLLGTARGADLVICEQATSQAVIYPLFVRAKLSSAQRFAFWGHGRNFRHGRASSTGEAVKRWMSRRVDWWFTYNEAGVAVLSDLGFPPERITNFQNAVDTSALSRARDTTSDSDLAGLRDRLGVGSGDVAVYVGGMYREKRLPFLLAACDEIRRQIPDFTMLFIGDGPDASLVRAAAESRQWLHHLGPLFAADKVPYVMLSKLQLMPGLVGLTILDSFALGVPLVTVADSEHSPEIAYLDDGANGVMLPAGTSPEGYAREVVRLLRDDAARRRLVAGCLAARSTYTLDAMVGRFTAGVEQALGTGPPARGFSRMGGVAP